MNRLKELQRNCGVVKHDGNKQNQVVLRPAEVVLAS
jgi:hypothetical protein